YSSQSLVLSRALHDLASCPTRRSSDLDRERCVRFEHRARYQQAFRAIRTDQTAQRGLQAFRHGQADLHLVEPDAIRAARHDPVRSEEHTSELQSRENLVCRLLLEKKNR